MAETITNLADLVGTKWGVGEEYAKLPDLSDPRFFGLDLSAPPVPGKLAICLLCAKPFVMPQFIGEPDQACPDCIRTLRDTARIVCSRCKRVVARQTPKVLDCGFYIRPRSVLHIDRCNRCSPGVLVSKIVEVDEYMRRHFVPKTIVPVTNPYVDVRKTS